MHAAYKIGQRCPFSLQDYACSIYTYIQDTYSIVLSFMYFGLSLSFVNQLFVLLSTIKYRVRLMYTADRSDPLELTTDLRV